MKEINFSFIALYLMCLSASKGDDTIFLVWLVSPWLEFIYWRYFTILSVDSKPTNTQIINLLIEYNKNALLLTNLILIKRIRKIYENIISDLIWKLIRSNAESVLSILRFFCTRCDFFIIFMEKKISYNIVILK